MVICQAREHHQIGAEVSGGELGIQATEDLICSRRTYRHYSSEVHGKNVPVFDTAKHTLYRFPNIAPTRARRKDTTVLCKLILIHRFTGFAKG
jgi:hypothetical protein